MIPWHPKLLTSLVAPNYSGYVTQRKARCISFTFRYLCSSTASAGPLSKGTRLVSIIAFLEQVEKYLLSLPLFALISEAETVTIMYLTEPDQVLLMSNRQCGTLPSELPINDRSQRRTLQGESFGSIDLSSKPSATEAVSPNSSSAHFARRRSRRALPSGCLRSSCRSLNIV
jgi:hypothetical protein